MDSENYRDNKEIPNLNLSDNDEQSLDSDSQFLSPDDLSFTENQNLKAQIHNNLPSKLKPQFKNIPYTKTPELNDSLISKMSTLNLKDRPVSLNVDVKMLGAGLDSGKDSKQNFVLQTTTDHPLKTLSPEVDYPDVVPKIVSSELKLETDLSNGFTPQRNNSKSNLYVENFCTPEYQSFIDSESKEYLSPLEYINAENFLNSKLITKTGFNASILCKSSSTPTSNVIKQDLNVSAIKNLVQSSNRNKSEYNRNISNAEIEESYKESTNHKSFFNYDLPIEMTVPPVPTIKCPQSPDLLSSPSQEDRSKYEAIIDPKSCNVILKHTPAADSAARQTMRRRIAVPEDNISTDSGSICSEELEDDSPEQQGTSQLVSPSYVLERDRDGAAESSGVSGMAIGRDASASNVSQTADKSSNSTSTSEPIPEYSLEEEMYRERSWMDVPVSNAKAITCDMRVIEPFKRVVSHGGYTQSQGAIIVISACRLPHCARADYHYVMSHLFLYVMGTLEKLVTDSYVLVYLHGACSKGRIPSWHWLKECYKLIDRRLRKSLKRLYLVHPTFWLKSLLVLSKPFVSHKFYNKVTYVNNLRELMQRIPVEPNAIPDIVKDYDSTLK